ncbi:MAG: hypothetical protein ABH851_02845 [Methanobacteriota archaeon]
MKNNGRVYKITSAVIIIAAITLIVLIIIVWYLYGFDYVVAPKTVTMISQTSV